MGGYGSGRPGWRPVEDQSLELRFDRALHDALRTARTTPRGVVSRVSIWSVHGRQIAQIAVWIFPERLVLSYTVNGESRRETFPIVSTPTPYGARPWWRCYCGRRCLRLYNPYGRGWRCRQCWNITYRSSCDSDKRLAYHRIWGAIDRRGLVGGCSTGALIVALKGYERAQAKIEREFQQAEREGRKGTKGGRPRKRG